MAAALLVVLADDLVWSTRLLAAARAAGAEAVGVRSVPDLVAAVADGSTRAIVDLTGRTYDGIEATAAACRAGAATLAVGPHEAAELRERARAAGAHRVLPYRVLFEDGAATIGAWLNATASADAPRGPATASADLPGGPATASADAPGGPATASADLPGGPATARSGSAGSSR